MKIPTPDYSNGPESLVGTVLEITDYLHVSFGEAVRKSEGDNRPDLTRVAIGKLSYPSWKTGVYTVQYLYIQPASEPWPPEGDLAKQFLEQRLVSVVEEALNGVFYSTVEDRFKVYRGLDFQPYLDSYMGFRGVQPTDSNQYFVSEALRLTAYMLLHDNIVLYRSLKNSELYGNNAGAEEIWLCPIDAVYPKLDRAQAELNVSANGMRVEVSAPQELLAEKELIGHPINNRLISDEAAGCHVLLLHRDLKHYFEVASHLPINLEYLSNWLRGQTRVDLELATLTDLQGRYHVRRCDIRGSIFPIPRDDEWSIDLNELSGGGLNRTFGTFQSESFPVYLKEPKKKP